MPRGLLSVVVVLVLVLGGVTHAESKPTPFDYFTNTILAKTIDTEAVKKLDAIELEDLADHESVLPGITGTLLVVKTGQGRNAKLLVKPARQKIDGDKLLPILLIERYVTYKEGQEQNVLAQGEGIKLYPGFRFSLDLGQVVPEVVPADLTLVADGDKVHLKPLSGVRMTVLTKYDKSIEPVKQPKVVIADPFEPKYFNGTYRLYDDGRRTGKLVLKVDEEGNVSGAFFSDRDGAKYDLRGRVGNPNHSLQFTVNLPRTEQVFTGWLFTGDGKALVGTSRILNRDAGFYALRVDE